MPITRLTLQEFREDFPCDSSNESIAQDVLQYLRQEEPLYQAARAYLDGERCFEEALVSAGIRRD